VAQLHDEHLTTEQLSASFDKQLSLEEQAVFDAHLSTCQQCQGKLADLQLTVAMLRAMPEEEVPRSFVLPRRLVPVPERPVRESTTVTLISQKRRTKLSTLQRSVRVVSTIAAVLALFLIISGILPSLHFGGVATSSGGSASNPVAAPAHTSVGAQTPGNTAKTPNVHTTPATRPQEVAGTATATHTLTPGPTPNATSQSNTGTGPPADQTPPVLDLGQPAGRLSLGALLLALSIIGLIITRRRRGVAT